MSQFTIITKDFMEWIDVKAFSFVILYSYLHYFDDSYLIYAKK